MTARSIERERIHVLHAAGHAVVATALGWQLTTLNLALTQCHGSITFTTPTHSACLDGNEGIFGATTNGQAEGVVRSARAAVLVAGRVAERLAAGVIYEQGRRWHAYAELVFLDGLEAGTLADSIRSD